MSQEDLQEYLQIVEECLELHHLQNCAYSFPNSPPPYSPSSPFSSASPCDSLPQSPSSSVHSPPVPSFTCWSFNPLSPSSSVPSPIRSPSSPSSSPASSPTSSPTYFSYFSRISTEFKKEKKRDKKASRKKLHDKQRARPQEEEAEESYRDFRSASNVCDCEGCTRRECQTCKYCLDQKRYGGKRKLRQRCILRRCCYANAGSWPKAQ